jgi:serine/threonine protein kinase
MSASSSSTTSTTSNESAVLAQHLDIMTKGQNDPLYASSRTLVMPCTDENFVMKGFLPALCWTTPVYTSKQIMDVLGDFTLGRLMEVLAGRCIESPFVASIISSRAVAAVNQQMPTGCANIPHHFPAFLIERRKRCLLKRTGCSANSELKLCLYQVALGLRDIHVAGWVHGNIGPETILVNEKLANPLITGLENMSFGSITSIALCTVELDAAWNAPETQAVGRYGYRTRSVQGQSPSREVDIWQFGMTVYRKAFESAPPPHFSRDEWKQYSKYVEKAVEAEAKKRKESSDGSLPIGWINDDAVTAERVISGIFTEATITVEDRIKKNIYDYTGENIDSPWIKFIMTCLRCDPMQRPTMTQVLADPLWTEASATLKTMNNGVLPESNPPTVVLPTRISDIAPALNAVINPTPTETTKRTHRDITSILQALAKKFKQRGLFPGVEEQRVAVAGWMILQMMNSTMKVDRSWASWLAFSTPIDQFRVLLRAASRLLFDGYRLGRDKFTVVDRGIFEGVKVLSNTEYQMLYDAELVMLCMLGNGWRGIVV